MLYTTLTSLQAYLGANDISQSSEIESLLSSATAMLDTELGQNIWQITRTRRIDGSGTCRLIMERSDITAVSSVTDVRTGSSYIVDTIERSVVYLTRQTDKWHKNIEITYTAGYTTVPLDLERYFLEYCKALYTIAHATDTKFTKTKKLGDLSITYFSPSEISSDILARPDMVAILRKYKNFQVCVSSK